MGKMTETIKKDGDTLLSQGVCFDPELIRLEGFYHDELSAYRARRTWKRALECHFLLEEQEDFDLEVDEDSEWYSLVCTFQSACARYAFWRLTNHQAPEAQYMIETAHIPKGETHQDEFLFAPDMRSIDEGPLVLSGDRQTLSLNDSWFEKVKTIISRISGKD